MNTQEARRELRLLAAEGLAIVHGIRESRAVSTDGRSKLRSMSAEARTLLSEAGYPGEAVWRGLQRAALGVETSLDSFDAAYWQDVIDELERGVATLASLDSLGGVREADFRIVG